MTTRITSAVKAPFPVSGVRPGLVPVAVTRIQSVSLVKTALMVGLRSPEIATGTVCAPVTVVAGMESAGGAVVVPADSAAKRNTRPIVPVAPLLMRLALPLVILTASTIELPNPGGNKIRWNVDAEAVALGGIT